MIGARTGSVLETDAIPTNDVAAPYALVGVDHQHFVVGTERRRLVDLPIAVIVVIVALCHRPQQQLEEDHPEWHLGRRKVICPTDSVPATRVRVKVPSAGGAICVRIPLLPRSRSLCTNKVRMTQWPPADGQLISARPEIVSIGITHDQSICIVRVGPTEHYSLDRGVEARVGFWWGVV